jgi:hypothetical protein
MIIDKFKTRNNMYVLNVVIYDFWADPVIQVIENGRFIGYINKRYSIDEAKAMIKEKKAIIKSDYYMMFVYSDYEGIKSDTIKVSQ